MFERTKGAVKNGQSTQGTRHRTKTNKTKNTTQKTKIYAKTLTILVAVRNNITSFSP